MLQELVIDKELGLEFEVPSPAQRFSLFKWFLSSLHYLWDFKAGEGLNKCQSVNHSASSTVSPREAFVSFFHK